MPELKIKISGDGSGFDAAMNRVERRARAGATAIQRGIGTAISGRLGAVFGAAALEQTARKTIELGSNIHDLAKETNLTYKEFQRWGYAAEQNGATIDDVSRAFRGLSKARREAMQNPTGETAEAFAALGITPQDLQSLSQNALATKIGTAFQQNDFGDQQQALAEKVLGRGGSAMLATFQDDFQKLGDEAERLGAIIEDKTIDELDQLGDELSKITAMFRGPLAQSVLFAAKALQAIVSIPIGQFKALGHLSAIIGANPFTQSGRDMIKQSLIDSAAATGESYLPLMRLLGIIPDEPEAEGKTRPHRDATPRLREAAKAARKIDLADTPQLGDLGKVGGFVHGIGPGMLAMFDPMISVARDQLEQQKITNEKLGQVVDKITFSNDAPDPFT